MTATAVAPNPFTGFCEKYLDHPVAFVREVLGVVPDPWQERVMECYGAHERKISIRSAHGPGKTAVAAWCGLHQLLFRYPQKTVATAPSAPQLYDAFYVELKFWVKQLPTDVAKLLNVKAERMELLGAPQGSFLSCRTSRSEAPEALQGIHSENVLLICDEASGIPEGVYEAASGSMSGENATTLLISNPVRGQGYFYDTHHRNKAFWNTFHVSAFDSPRVTQAFIDEIGQAYGEDSNVYRVRVLGEFPKMDEDTIIPFDLVEAAQDRDVETNPYAPVVWGVDVARFGGERSALCKRKANLVTEPIKTWRDLDLMQLVGRIKNIWDDTPTEDRPVEINVDVIGLGAGVVDRLRELDLPCRGINVSESPAMGETYKNLRTELWFSAKDWLAKRDCRLPSADITLARELVVPKYEYTSTGKLSVMAHKRSKRLSPGDTPSPDCADAFVLTFAGNAITALGGQRIKWSEKLDRGLKGID